MIYLRENVKFVGFIFILIFSYAGVAAPELIFEESPTGLKAVLSEEEASLVGIKIINKNKENIYDGVMLIFLKEGDFRGLKCGKSATLSGRLKALENKKYMALYYQLSSHTEDCSFGTWQFKTAYLDENFRLVSFFAGGTSLIIQRSRHLI